MSKTDAVIAMATILNDLPVEDMGDALALFIASVLLVTATPAQNWANIKTSIDATLVRELAQ